MIVCIGIVTISPTIDPSCELLSILNEVVLAARDRQMTYVIVEVESCLLARANFPEHNLNGEPSGQRRYVDS